MKNNKHIVPVALGASMLMVIIAATISMPKTPTAANSGDKATPIILASAHSPEQSNAVAAVAAQPKSIPVPCPIWMIGQITGYAGTNSQSTDSAKPGPKIVPGGLWFMQKLGEAYRKTL